MCKADEITHEAVRRHVAINNQVIFCVANLNKVKNQFFSFNFETEKSPRLRRLSEEVPHAAGVGQPRRDAQRAEALRVRHLSGSILTTGMSDSDCKPLYTTLSDFL